jgi:hypothetical protein
MLVVSGNFFLEKIVVRRVETVVPAANACRIAVKAVGREIKIRHPLRGASSVPGCQPIS